MAARKPSIKQLETENRKLKLELANQVLEIRSNFLKREKSRFRHFEAAAKTARTQGWKTPAATGPITTLSMALSTIRERSRDQVRNNGYAESAINTIVSGMVGYGVSYAIKNKRLAALWNAWSENPLYCDARKKQNMGGLQAMAVRTWAIDGEVLFRRVVRKDWKAGEHPYAIQILEPDLLDSSKDNRALGIRQGIELDAFGAPIAYWLFPDHPSEGIGSRISERISASEIGHMYWEKRPGQIRGIPLFAPVIMRMHDLDDYQDAQLTRQKLAACFMAFVTNIEGEDEAQRPEANELVEMLEPGIIQPLRLGENVEFANPPGVTGYGEYTNSHHHGIAAGIGITFEDMTGDYSMVSWSSGRLGRLKFYANLDTWQWNMLVPNFCDKIWKWFLEGAEFLGIPTKSAVVDYTLPRRPVADLNEYKARRDEVRAGFKSISEAIRENGYDPDKILEENREFLEKADTVGQVYDCDPRRITGFGQAQPYQVDTTSPPGDQGKPAPA